MSSLNLMNSSFRAILPCLILLAPAAANADDLGPGRTFAIAGHDHGVTRADGHAPIGVMGDHMHKKGEWMLSYRYMHMNMEGNRIGDDKVSPQEIVATVPNRFGPPGMIPPTLRVVPTRMEMDMHMFGAMYAPTNNLTLMAMVNYLEKEMDHLTFMGGASLTPPVIGGFTTRSEGFGDTKIGALYRLYDDRVHHFHLNMGLSLPTGDIKQRDTVLTPMGTNTNLRLPYAMQLGTGTFDLLPGITYTGHAGDISWGAQYMAEVRLEDENDEGYAWGDKHQVTGWLAYQWAPWISTSFRATYSHMGEIEGSDPVIAAPVQTAYPEFFGGERVEFFGGINLAGQSGPFKGHRLAIEAGAPVHEDLNGPQMSRDWTLTVGWQKAF